MTRLFVMCFVCGLLRRVSFWACFAGGAHWFLFSVVCAGVLFIARLCHCFDYGVLRLRLAFLRSVVFVVRCLCSIGGVRYLLCVVFAVC